MRKTSVETYRQIMSEGLLSKMRFKVYETIFKYGPITARQCNEFISGGKHLGGSVTSRFSELEALGVIEPIRVIKCPTTARPVTLWDVTGKLPGEPKKRSKINYGDFFWIYPVINVDGTYSIRTQEPIANKNMWMKVREVIEKRINLK